MNIQTEQDFQAFLHDYHNATVMAFDTETNGLRYYRDNFIISMSFYFPEFKRSYNLPFAHGQGTIEGAEGNFFEMNWQGAGKGILYLKYWFEYFRAITDFENTNFIHRLRSVWRTDIRTIMHNARFDCHMLASDGFAVPTVVEDTMIALHVVNEDWMGIQVDSPFKWTKTDHSKGKCSEEMIGTWARDPKGGLTKKRQQGNRQLKWQSAFWGLEGATEGEDELRRNKLKFEDSLTDFIMERLDDPYNESLRYKKENDKQWDRIRAKISIDDKSQMWMLPSSYVSEYAELDVRLTWALREKLLPIIREWNNEELYYQQCDVLRHIAWEMEYNGVKLDVPRTRSEITRMEARITDIEECLAPYETNLGSWQQLLKLLNSGVLAQPFDNFPSWWEEERKLGLKVYPSIVVDATSHEAMEEIEDHGIVRLILEWRKMKKSVDTYLKKWMSAQDVKGLIHGSFNPDGTVSGRFSSSGEAGNWQNIPDRNGYEIKKSIVPYNDEWMFFACDYGQLEARIASWIAETLLREQGVHDYEPTMTNLFLSGVDMHVYTRDMIGIRDVLYPNMSDEEIVVKMGYSLSSDKVNTPELREMVVAQACRQSAKTANFGLLYSGTKYMLSKLLKIDLEPADVIVQKWKKLFPAFQVAQDYFTNVALTVRKSPRGGMSAMYATQPISGRHRKLHKYDNYASFFKDGRWQTWNPKEANAKKVWNNTVQGLGGWMTSAGLLNFKNEYGFGRLKPFAIIHDAVDGYVRRDSLYLLEPLRNALVNFPEVVPNLTTDLQGSLTTWQDLRTVDEYQLWVESNGTEGYKKKK